MIPYYPVTGAEISDALQFVIGHLDVKMILKPGQQVERLQAVDVECLEEVLVRFEQVERHLEVLGGKIENFFQGLILGIHNLFLG